VSLLPRAHLLALGGLVAGCTTILGINEDYSPRQEAVSGGSGGTGGTRPTSGGSAGVGGSTGATGGLGGVGGSGATGSGGTGTPICTPTQKVCSFNTDAGTVQQCFDPEPIVGCSEPGCQRCPGSYPNADPICVDGGCDWRCAPGYMPDPGGSGSCVAESSGGAGGGSGGTGATGGSTSTGGTGGTTVCDPKTCGMCNPAGPFPCCKLDHTCGCTWAPGAICY
jgi:hypothetical protein